ncbi:hypothetical protein [Agromyces kandeliae]|uniref:Nucleotidyltransferase domain-containing protein n=1 Tax=Agromyces kandeliae TaxID=2666141 RepID=A0A6L5R1W3_9MICO|nr:hypothetical protein [Agromyces kandeliae]MRX43017.1 hypothetical protein [Agromyces kandeliae]
MTGSSARERFDAFLERVDANLVDRADVVGLVGMGSTADRDRVDEWSDHDLAIVTTDGHQPGYRRPADWLPRPDRIALEVHEHHGGVKVVYDDGHVVEFGVASLDDLAGWAADAYDVRLDRGGVAATMSEVAAKPAPIGPDVDRDLGLVLALTLIGVGRARRGERLSANTLVRGTAVEALTRAVASRLEPEEGDARLDSLDPSRRFERAYPSIAARIDGLLAAPVESCARGLVDLAVEVFGTGDGGVPARGLAAVHRRLGW